MESRYAHAIPSELAEVAFSQIAGWFSQAASKAVEGLWSEFDSATTIDVDSPQLATDLVATSAIDGVFCLPLFAKQGSGAAVFLAIHIMRPPTQRLRGKQKFDMASGDQ